ncbi:MAG: alpha/beta fold hydrolase [Trebonia sp.]
MRFVLVHGGWQGGWCWDQVAARLRTAGHEVLAPTLAGLGPDESDRFDITATEMARRLADDLRAADETNLIAVGHSGGGPIVQLLHELIPDRLDRLVFVDAWVLADGERVYDVLPAPLAESLQAAADAAPGRLIPMPGDFWVHGLCNDMPEETARGWLDRVVPCPDGWMSERLPLPGFAGSALPASYVFLADDVAVSQDVYQDCAARLGRPSTATSPGGHEAMLSQPGPLADALLAVCR